MRQKVSASYKWLQSKFFVAIAVIAFGVGLLLALNQDHLPFPEAIGHIGVALMTAVIVGAALDWFFHQRLVEDVFKASIGYILPDDLKGEVRALYEAPFVCIEHVQDAELLPISGHPDVVCLHTTIRRTFRNVTSSPRRFDVRVSLTEWLHHPSLRSRILDLGCVVDGKRFTERGSVEREAGLNKINQALQHPVAIAPDQTVTVWHETIETKRTTDVAHFVFEHPTKDPLVTFRSLVPTGDDDAVVGIIRFNSRHREERDQIGQSAYRMRGTLNPYQSIELRWFRRNDLRAWVEEQPSGSVE